MVLKTRVAVVGDEAHSKPESLDFRQQLTTTISRYRYFPDHHRHAAIQREILQPPQSHNDAIQSALKCGRAINVLGRRHRAPLHRWKGSRSSEKIRMHAAEQSRSKSIHIPRSSGDFLGHRRDRSHFIRTSDLQGFYCGPWATLDHHHVTNLSLSSCQDKIPLCSDFSFRSSPSTGKLSPIQGARAPGASYMNKTSPIFLSSHGNNIVGALMPVGQKKDFVNRTLFEEDEELSTFRGLSSSHSCPLSSELFRSFPRFRRDDGLSSCFVHYSPSSSDGKQNITEPTFNSADSLNRPLAKFPLDVDLSFLRHNTCAAPKSVQPLFSTTPPFRRTEILPNSSSVSSGSLNTDTPERRATFFLSTGGRGNAPISMSSLFSEGDDEIALQARNFWDGLRFSLSESSSMFEHECDPSKRKVRYDRDENSDFFWCNGASVPFRDTQNSQYTGIPRQRLHHGRLMSTSPGNFECTAEIRDEKGVRSGIRDFGPSNHHPHSGLDNEICRPIFPFNPCVVKVSPSFSQSPKDDFYQRKPSDSFAPLLGENSDRSSIRASRPCNDPLQCGAGDNISRLWPPNSTIDLAVPSVTDGTRIQDDSTKIQREQCNNMIQKKNGVAVSSKCNNLEKLMNKDEENENREGSQYRDSAPTSEEVQKKSTESEYHMEVTSFVSSHSLSHQEKLAYRPVNSYITMDSEHFLPLRRERFEAFSCKKKSDQGPGIDTQSLSKSSDVSNDANARVTLSANSLAGSNLTFSNRQAEDVGPRMERTRRLTNLPRQEWYCGESESQIHYQKNQVDANPKSDSENRASSNDALGLSSRGKSGEWLGRLIQCHNFPNSITSSCPLVSWSNEGGTGILPTSVRSNSRCQGDQTLSRCPLQSNQVLRYNPPQKKSQCDDFRVEQCRRSLCTVRQRKRNNPAETETHRTSCEPSLAPDRLMSDFPVCAETKKLVSQSVHECFGDTSPNATEGCCEALVLGAEGQISIRSKDSSNQSGPRNSDTTTCPSCLEDSGFLMTTTTCDFPVQTTESWGVDSTIFCDAAVQTVDMTVVDNDVEKLPVVVQSPVPREVSNSGSKTIDSSFDCQASLRNITQPRTFGADQLSEGTCGLQKNFHGDPSLIRNSDCGRRLNRRGIEEYNFDEVGVTTQPINEREFPHFSGNRRLQSDAAVQTHTDLLDGTPRGMSCLEQSTQEGSTPSSTFDPPRFSTRCVILKDVVHESREINDSQVVRPMVKFSASTHETSFNNPNENLEKKSNPENQNFNVLTEKTVEILEDSTISHPERLSNNSIVVKDCPDHSGVSSQDTSVAVHSIKSHGSDEFEVHLKISGKATIRKEFERSASIRTKSLSPDNSSPHLSPKLASIADGSQSIDAFCKIESAQNHSHIKSIGTAPAEDGNTQAVQRLGSVKSHSASSTEDGLHTVEDTDEILGKKASTGSKITQSRKVGVISDLPFEEHDTRVGLRPMWNPNITRDTNCSFSSIQWKRAHPLQELHEQWERARNKANLEPFSQEDERLLRETSGSASETLSRALKCQNWRKNHSLRQCRARDSMLSSSAPHLWRSCAAFDCINGTHRRSSSTESPLSRLIFSNCSREGPSGSSQSFANAFSLTKHPTEGEKICRTGMRPASSASSIVERLQAVNFSKYQTSFIQPYLFFDKKESTTRSCEMNDGTRRVRQQSSIGLLPVFEARLACAEETSVSSDELDKEEMSSLHRSKACTSPILKESPCFDAQIDRLEREKVLFDGASQTHKEKMQWVPSGTERSQTLTGDKRKHTTAKEEDREPQSPRVCCGTSLFATGDNLKEKVSLPSDCVLGDQATFAALFTSVEDGKKKSQKKAAFTRGILFPTVEEDSKARTRKIVDQSISRKNRGHSVAQCHPSTSEDGPSSNIPALFCGREPSDHQLNDSGASSNSKTTGEDPKLPQRFVMHNLAKTDVTQSPETPTDSSELKSKSNLESTSELFPLFQDGVFRSASTPTKRDSGTDIKRCWFDKKVAKRFSMDGWQPRDEVHRVPPNCVSSVKALKRPTKIKNRNEKERMFAGRFIAEGQGIDCQSLPHRDNGTILNDIEKFTSQSQASWLGPSVPLQGKRTRSQVQTGEDAETGLPQPEIALTAPLSPIRMVYSEFDNSPETQRQEEPCIQSTSDPIVQDGHILRRPPPFDGTHHLVVAAISSTLQTEEGNSSAADCRSLAPVNSSPTSRKASGNKKSKPIAGIHPNIPTHATGMSKSAKCADDCCSRILNRERQNLKFQRYNISLSEASELNQNEVSKVRNVDCDGHGCPVTLWGDNFADPYALSLYGKTPCKLASPNSASSVQQNASVSSSRDIKH